MKHWSPYTVPLYIKKKLFSKSFFSFFFSFIAVVTGVLLFILVLGVSSGVQ
jgi:ABC-type lipoprotein release transport system permease subunit